MSFDLFSQEAAARVSTLPQVSVPDPGAFKGFLGGTSTVAMQSFAKAGRAASLAVGGMLEGVERLGAEHPLQPQRDTRMTDAWFRMHDDVFQRAVDFWTPKPGEVGAAGEIAGQLIAAIPLVIGAPSALVATTQMSVAEDLVRKGVDSGKAQAVGAVQAAGMGVGIWLPILGQNLWQRVALGGVGFNALQGVVTRGASHAILEGTPAADDFRAFDPQQLTLDVLLGAAFGTLAHLSPAQRAQGAETWNRIKKWAGTLEQSDVDALATLRQAQHLNVDSAPGRPETALDLDRHVQAMRQAIDDLANDRPVNVTDLVDGAKFEVDPARQVVSAYVQEPGKPGADAPLSKPRPGSPGQGADPVTRDTQSAFLQRTGQRGPEATEGTVSRDPVALEAVRFAQSNPDFQIRVGESADGSPLIVKASEFLRQADDVMRQAQEEASLFEVAAACMLGVR